MTRKAIQSERGRALEILTNTEGERDRDFFYLRRDGFGWWWFSECSHLCETDVDRGGPLGQPVCGAADTPKCRPPRFAKRQHRRCPACVKWALRAAGRLGDAGLELESGQARVRLMLVTGLMWAGPRQRTEGTRI